MRRGWGALLVGVPPLVWYLALFVAPLAVIVHASLEPGAYARALVPPFGAVFLQTLRIAGTGTLLCLLLGFPLAVFLARSSGRARVLLLALLVVPFWSGFVLRTLAWRIVLAPNGWPSGLLQAAGLLDGPLQVLDTRVAVQIGVLSAYLPLLVFPLFVVLERQDPALRDAARDLGAGALATFLRVTLPLARPGIVAGAVLVFVPLCGEYVTPAALGGARGLMAGSLVAGQFLVARNTPVGAAMAVTLVAVILAALATAALIAMALGRVHRRAQP